MAAAYENKVELLKVLADTNRIMIVDMLSCGELCACKILEKFDFSQPGLSYHMKLLCDCGLVVGRKEGKWMYYSLNQSTVHDIQEFLRQITTDKESSVCIEGACECGDE